MHFHRDWHAWAAFALLLAATGCRDFDERWTEIVVTADPEVIAVADFIDYCVWEGDRPAHTVVGSGESVDVRSACDETASGRPIPGTIVVRNERGVSGTLRAFFQLNVRSGGGDCLDVCDPDRANPVLGAGNCVTSDPNGVEILVEELYDPPRYSVHFASSGSVVVTGPGQDAGVAIPGCE